MTLPIISYGHNILERKCKDIKKTYPGLDELINNMWETLYAANGCGLAAPQVNYPIRIFLVDSKQTYDNMEKDERDEFFIGDTGIRETFINAKILNRSPEEWIDIEGCLSIPTLIEEVERPWSITIEYYNREFNRRIKTFSGITARMIQHEYDHTEGILYLDHLKLLKLSRLKPKLEKISKGDIEVPYEMKFLK